MATSAPGHERDSSDNEPDHRSDAMRHADTANGEPAADERDTPTDGSGPDEDKEDRP